MTLALTRASVAAVIVEAGRRDYEDEFAALGMYLVLLRDLDDLIADGVVRWRAHRTRNRDSHAR